jgi:hypothetical protein
MKIKSLLIKTPSRNSLWTLGVIITLCLGIGNANAQSSLAVSTTAADDMSSLSSTEVPWLSDAVSITRAEILAMTEEDRKEVLTHIKNYMISDLINATPETINPRLDYLTYMKVVEFYYTDLNTRMKAISEPQTYIIF